MFLPAHILTSVLKEVNMSHNVRKLTFCYVCLTKTRVSLRICTVWSVFIVHLKKLQIWQSKICLVKILIRPHKCTAEPSESSLGVHAPRQVFWCCSLCVCNSSKTWLESFRFLLGGLNLSFWSQFRATDNFGGIWVFNPIKI